jgi:hypothetical protein
MVYYLVIDECDIVHKILVGGIPYSLNIFVSSTTL